MRGKKGGIKTNGDKLFEWISVYVVLCWRDNASTLDWIIMIRGWCDPYTTEAGCDCRGPKNCTKHVATIDIAAMTRNNVLYPTDTANDFVSMPPTTEAMAKAL